MPSLASTGSMVASRPTATSASQRCMAVSWAMRRITKRTEWSSVKVHTSVSGSAWPSSSSSPAKLTRYAGSSRGRSGRGGRS